MDLLEYQAKTLFREVGIPVLPSQCIDASRAVKQLKIPYPVVLKSQVRAAGRGKAGGVRFVENTIDAIAAAQSILDLPIGGEYPQVLLAEARYDAQQELFLAIVFDYQLQCPVLLGSAQGGAKTANQETIQSVAIAGEFSPFYARRLAIEMGLASSLVPPISCVVEKMYRLFVSKDLNSIEINPLGIGPDGEVMALDGKIAANDCALGRHADLQALLQCQPVATEAANDVALPETPATTVQWFEWGTTAGEIAIVTNRTGLGMTTWDLLSQQQAKPGGCLLVELPTPEAADTLTAALEQVAAMQVAAIAINLLADPPILQAAAAAIARYCQQSQAAAAGSEDRINRPTALVLRLGSTATSAALQAEWSELAVCWAEHSPALAEYAAAIATERSPTSGRKPARPRSRTASSHRRRSDAARA